MKRPTNYENTTAYGDFEPLELGGHICTICKVVETQSRTGKDMIEVWLDIAEGPQKGYYTAQWRNDSRENKKWPCIVYQLVEDNEGNTNRGYKTFLESVKKSNSGFVEDKLWEVNGAEYLKGKLVGGVFGREQYLNQKGELKWSTKCVQFRSVEAIQKGVDVPEDKLLAGAKQPPQGNVFAAMEDSESYGDLPF